MEVYMYKVLLLSTKETIVGLVEENGDEITIKYPFVIDETEKDSKTPGAKLLPYPFSFHVKEKELVVQKTSVIAQGDPLPSLANYYEGILVQLNVWTPEETVVEEKEAA